MKRKLKCLPYIVLVCILFLSLGYASFSSKLTISGIAASVRPERNIRVTSFYAIGNENNGQSFWEDFSINRISSDIYMPNENSTVSYKVGVTNLGGISMSVRDIVGIPDNLEVVYNDYKFGETLCDDSKNEEPCKYGAYDEFTIVIKYKDGMFDESNTEYQLRLDLSFDCSYTVNYLSDELFLDIATSLDSDKDKVVKNDNVYTLTKNTNYGGLYIPSENLEDGKIYLLKYKIKKLSGTLVNIGGHSMNSIEKAFFIDSEPSSYSYNQPKANIVDDMNEHVIEFKFEYDLDVDNSVSNDLSIYIQPNRKSGEAVPVVVDIYDIELYEVIEEKTYNYEETGVFKSEIFKTGYNFIEWNTDISRNGSSFVPGLEFNGLSSDNAKQIYLYAIWEKYKDYSGYYIYNVAKDNAVMDNLSSKYVSSSSGINFFDASSITNGNGKYIISDTINDNFPIYYYRGNVHDNNVIFGNFCWKILRTTNTGGTKLIYNGLPVDGKCDNHGTDTLTHTGITYGVGNYGLSSGGYSYTDKSKLVMATRAVSKILEGTIFANDIEYVDIIDETTGEVSKKYRLVGDKVTSTSNFKNEREELLKEHHYTCFSTTDDVCTTAYYIYMVRDNNNYYATLSNGMLLDDLLKIEFEGNSTNTLKSNIHSTVEKWYAASLNNFSDYIEDAVYCNDRSLFQPWSNTTSVANTDDAKIHFGAKARIAFTGKVSVDCPNVGDSFTSNAANGNGALTYPIGLITLDEVNLAGFAWGKSSTDNYLYNDGKVWWSMSPGFVSATGVYIGVIYSTLDHVAVNYIGSKDSNGVYSAGGVRPVISLKYGIVINGGDGSVDNPLLVQEIS